MKLGDKHLTVQLSEKSSSPKWQKGSINLAQIILIKIIVLHWKCSSSESKIISNFYIGICFSVLPAESKSPTQPLDLAPPPPPGEDEELTAEEVQMV